MAATDNYNLAEEQQFRNKVDSLMRKVAEDIKGEVPTELKPQGVVDKRGILSDKILWDRTRGAEYMVSKAIAAQGTLTGSSTDGDIEFMIAQVYDDMANVNDSDWGTTFDRIRYMAVYDNASKLTIDLLLQSGVNSPDPAKLDQAAPNYRTAISGEDDFADISALQLLIDSVV